MKQQQNGSGLNKTVPAIGPGLRNGGNTCYINSVLQCLTYTAPLAALFAKGAHRAQCPRATRQEFCCMCLFEKHVTRCSSLQEENQEKSFLPEDILMRITQIFPSYVPEKQEDVQEFLRKFIEALVAGSKRNSQSKDADSPVYQMFVGQQKSVLSCQECLQSTENFTPIMDISLRERSLEEIMQKYFQSEVMNGKINRLYCDSCKCIQNKIKQLSIFKEPSILTLHVARFWNMSKKNSRKITFPLQLSIEPFQSVVQQRVPYELFALIVHEGYNISDGHYYCYVKSAAGLWFKLNDEIVTQVSEREVLDEQAYLLFYARKNITASGGNGSASSKSSNSSCCEELQIVYNSDSQTKKQNLTNGNSQQSKSPVTATVPQITLIRSNSTITQTIQREGNAQPKVGDDQNAKQVSENKKVSQSTAGVALKVVKSSSNRNLIEVKSSVGSKKQQKEAQKLINKMKILESQQSPIQIVEQEEEEEEVQVVQSKSPMKKSDIQHQMAEKLNDDESKCIIIKGMCRYSNIKIEENNETPQQSSIYKLIMRNAQGRKRHDLIEREKKYNRVERDRISFLIESNVFHPKLKKQARSCYDTDTVNLKTQQQQQQQALQTQNSCFSQSAAQIKNAAVNNIKSSPDITRTKRQQNELKEIQTQSELSLNEIDQFVDEDNSGELDKYLFDTSHSEARFVDSHCLSPNKQQQSSKKTPANQTKASIQKKKSPEKQNKFKVPVNTSQKINQK